MGFDNNNNFEDDIAVGGGDPYKKSMARVIEKSKAK